MALNNNNNNYGSDQLLCCHQTGNSHKCEPSGLYLEQFLDVVLKLNVHSMYFTGRVVRHCSRLPREVFGTLPLETLQIKLDVALSNLIYLETLLLTSGRLDKMVFEGPFQLDASYDCLI